MNKNSIISIIKYSGILLLVSSLFLRADVYSVQTQYNLSPACIIEKTQEFNEYEEYGNPFKGRKNHIPMSEFWQLPNEAFLKRAEFNSFLLGDAHKSDFNHEQEQRIKQRSDYYGRSHSIFYEKLCRLARRIDYVHHRENADIACTLGALIKGDVSRFWYNKYHNLNSSVLDYNYIFLVSELLKNAYVHGNKLDLKKSVFIGWKIKNDCLYICVADHGCERAYTVLGQIMFSSIETDESYEKKYSIAKYLQLTGKRYGFRDLQDRYFFDLKLSSRVIKTKTGKEIGKFVTAKIPIIKPVKTDVPKKIRIKKIHFLIHPGYFSDPSINDDKEDARDFEALLQRYIEKAKQLNNNEVMILVSHTDSQTFAIDKEQGLAYTRLKSELENILGKRLIVVFDPIVFTDNDSDASEKAAKIIKLELKLAGFELDTNAKSEAYGESIDVCVTECADNLNKAFGLFEKTAINPDYTDWRHSFPQGVFTQEAAKEMEYEGARYYVLTCA